MRITFKLALAASLLASVGSVYAQPPRESSPQPRDRSIVTAEAPPAASVRNRSADDVEFLVEALRTALAEVELGRLAAERGQDPRVRDYGAMLVRDHEAHATELEKLLEPHGVNAPKEPSGEALSQKAALARLPAQEFDAAFVQMMVWTHTEAIEKYGAQTHANPDRALSDFASRTLPKLREHLATAQSLR